MSYLLLLSFSLLLSQISFCLTQCIDHQRSSLLQLKNSFSSFSPSSKLSSWQPNNSDCCTWQGVSCNSTTGYVIGLDLTNCLITGPINGSLFNPLHLQELNLANNILNSVLPSGFGGLANLTYLNLSNSGFQGRIPMEISSLTRLVVLDLSTNYLMATPYHLRFENSTLQMLVRSLTNLRDLRLDGINMSAEGSEWGQALSTLSNLRNVSFSNCYLSGRIDSSLLQLHHLTELHLSGNNLSTLVPEFLSNFSSLTLLRLSSCGLYGAFPKRILQLVNLRVLDVSENPHLTGSLPDFYQNNSLRVLLVRNCNFSGTIPASLANLTQLVHWDISVNSFDGEIPSLASLKNIQEIDLSHNLLTGSFNISSSDELPNLARLILQNNSINRPLPSSLFTLPSLQTLQLAQNQFGGGLPEFHISSSLLETVDLSNNKLQGPIPNSLFKLVGLKALALSSNNFSGTVNLSMFQTFWNLTTLDLSDNSLLINDEASNSTSFSSISNLRLRSCSLIKFPFLKNQSNWNSLDLSNNKIDGLIPGWIWNTGIRHLNLSHNALRGLDQPLPDISSSSLRIMDLHNNMLEGSIPNPPSSAIFIDYSNNRFNSVIPANISSNLNFSIFFSLSTNSLSGEIPQSICNARHLQVLDLSNNHFNGSIPECLSEMGNSLRVLNLRNNYFTGTLPQNFTSGCDLRTLDLNGNQLEGKVPRLLANCTMLEVVDLGNNQINDGFPSWLEELPSLSVLVLRSNKFHGHIRPPKNTSYFPNLKIIDLSSNRFTGTIPFECFQSWKAMMGTEGGLQIQRCEILELSNLYYQDMVIVTNKGLDMELVKILTIFTSIDLSNNAFRGEIPTDIGELKSLHVLNWSHNALTGSIPSSIGNLNQLESLDLSQNQLSGEIPAEITSLTFLSVVNLSWNLLVGPIPQGKQFLTFSNDSFEGNSRLCGPPLSRKCGDHEVLSPPPLQPSDEKSKFRCNWLLIFIELGLAVGLGIVIWPLVFWRKWRRWYFTRIDWILLAIYESD